MNLTKEQLTIVHHSGGHARVSAVAGSGKTTTMVARVGHLLSQGSTADQLMVLMFNRSARKAFADSMQKKLASLNSALPEVRTFHSLGLRLVESFTRRGILPKFTLVTEDYVQEKLARQVATQVYREQDNEGWLSRDQVEEFLGFIDHVKSSITSADKVFETLDMPSRYSYFVDSYTLFERVRKEQKIRFFADLIHEPLMAMLQDSELAAWVGNRVEHIIVDEYQDINEAQQQLLKIVAGKRAKVMVVGDVDQCIYEWRGAQPEYITTRFGQDFPQPQNYLLSYTFRYGHRLSLAANHLIGNNVQRDRKLCVSHSITPETTISFLEEKNGHSLITLLSQWQDEGRTLGEAAVLVRLFAQAVPVELALLEAGIPYRLEGNAQVFDCLEVLALTGYLKLALGILSNDEPETRKASVVAMLSQPHLGIKREQLELLADEICATPDSGSDLILARGQQDLPEFLRKRFKETAVNWRWLETNGVQGKVDLFLKNFVERIGLYDFYHKMSVRSATAENRVKTCQAFIDFTARQNLSALDLLEKIERLRETGIDPTQDSLLITSIHRAKGLEWPLVILPGLEDGSFPFFQMFGGGDENLEDERRLFYVAMTRAIEHLCISHPQDARLKRNIKKGGSGAPEDDFLASRFLFEANFGLSTQLGEMVHQETETAEIVVEAHDLSVARDYCKAVGLDLSLREKSGKKQRQPQARILTIEEIAEGLEVWHKVFGSGIVKAVKDRKQGRIEVCFEEHGDMILLAGYARLQPY